VKTKQQIKQRKMKNQNKENTKKIKVTFTDDELDEINSLAAYLDGYATPEESEAIEARLESDEELRDTVETFKFMQQNESEIERIFGDCDDDDLKAVEAKFTAALREETARRTKEAEETARRTKEAETAATAAAAAVAVAVAILPAGKESEKAEEADASISHDADLPVKAAATPTPAAALPPAGAVPAPATPVKKLNQFIKDLFTFTGPVPDAEGVIDMVKWENRKKMQTRVFATTGSIIVAAAAIVFAVPEPLPEPVYVYKDAGSIENKFSQPFWIGDSYSNIPRMNDSAVGFDSTGIMAEINFEHHEWGGYYFIVPVVDNTVIRPATGNDNAGIDLSGAKKLTFYAKGLEGSEYVEFFTAGLGYGDDFTDKYPDTCRKISLGFVQLTTEWTKYEIPLAGRDMSRIAGGFGWMSSSRPNAGRTVIRFCIDEIRFEFGN
jgi:hypothetical protein